MPENQAECGCDQAGPQSADAGGQQNGRDEEQEATMPVQQRAKPEPEQKQ